MGDLRLRLLGGLEVEGRSETEVGSRKARRLLKVLAVARGRSVTADALADAVWGDELPARPADQVGVLVSRLRGTLGAGRITRTDAGYALAADWIDVDELERQVAEARERLAAGDSHAARIAAAVALALARGPLLPDEDGDWVDLPRAAAERLVAGARRVAAEAALAVGDAGGAAEAAGAALDADRYDEAALRLLMRAHVVAGRPGSALAAYARLRAHLADDLGASPDPVTEALHTAILRGSEQPTVSPEPPAPTSDSRVAAQGWIAEHPEAAPTLRAAAVLGDPVDVELLALPTVTGAPVHELLGHVEAALAAGVLAERDGRLGLADEHVREALVEGTSGTRTAHLHRAAAQALLGRRGHDPLRVARHAEAGGDLPLAAAQLTDAALRAIDAGDAAGAVALADRAVALDDIPANRLARGRARLAALDLDGARADAEHAVARGGGAAALELAGWVAYYQRDLVAARLRAEEGAHRASDPVTLAGCRALTGRLRHSLGDLAGAEEDLRGAAEAATAVRGIAEIWLGGVLNHRGEPDAAVDAADRGLLERASLQHPFGALHGMWTRAYALGQRGRIAETRRVVEEWLADLAAMGSSGLRYLPVALNVQGWALRSAGRLDEADEHNERALAAVPAAHHEEPRNHALLDLADGALLRGDLVRAATLLDEVRLADEERGTMVWHQRQRWWLGRAKLASLAGDADEALELAELCALDAAERGARRAELLARATWATAVARAGRPVDLDGTDVVLAGLDLVAGMEVWRLTADLAAATGEDAWWKAAARRATEAIAAAGDDAPALTAWVDHELERLRGEGR